MEWAASTTVAADRQRSHSLSPLPSRCAQLFQAFQWEERVTNICYAFLTGLRLWWTWHTMCPFLKLGLNAMEAHC
uniref:Uncharacterized protein n=1 Tax=Oryza glumipatula TaxID=40148 RepID=A0A0E0B1A1_9ORYZ